MWKEFLKHLLSYDKKKCIQYCIDSLLHRKVDFVFLYENILGRALNEVGEMVENGVLRIWDEHVASSIVRSCIENTYLFIDDYKLEENRGNALVLCPRNELHEIGALMVNSFFEILGYKSFYLGANAPEKDISLAIEITNPKVIGVSISNYYNLTVLKDVLSAIKSKERKLIVGGTAVKNNKAEVEQFKHINIAETFDDIKKIVGENI